jgi:hypothetical protein
MTAGGEGFERLAEDYLRRFGEPLYPVGRIVEAAETTGIIWLEGGAAVEKNLRGFTHF